MSELKTEDFIDFNTGNLRAKKTVAEIERKRIDGREWRYRLILN